MCTYKHIYIYIYIWVAAARTAPPTPHTLALVRQHCASAIFYIYAYIYVNIYTHVHITYVHTYKHVCKYIYAGGSSENCASDSMCTGPEQCMDLGSETDWQTERERERERERQTDRQTPTRAWGRLRRKPPHTLAPGQATLCFSQLGQATLCLRQLWLWSGNAVVQLTWPDNALL